MVVDPLQPTVRDSDVTAPSPTTASADVLRRNDVSVSGNPRGPVVMFAHRFGCSKETWDLVAPRFDEDCTVVLFDHVGAGGSDVTAYDSRKYDSLEGYARDVVEVLDALAVSEVIFVGHSVSAMIGVLAANRRPDLFRKLVLVSPSPRYINDADYRGGFEQADVDAMLASLDANYLGWSRRTAPVIVGRPDRPELGERLSESFCRLDPEIGSQFARVTFTSDNREDLSRVTVPTLVLQCREDAIAPPEVGRFVHAAIPDSRFAVLDTTGHVPILSAPDEVTHEIREFLR